jgi:hypothetical protein
VTVHFLGDAWELVTTPTEDCPTVVDRDSGRGLDYVCSPAGTTPKGWAVAATAGSGLAFAALALLLAALLVLRVRSARRAAASAAGTAATMDGGWS